MMTSQLFVKNMKTAVFDNAVGDTVQQLINPAGRSPDTSHEATANWYLSLDKEAQNHAQQLAQLAANRVLFGVFAVFDGVRAIEDAGEKGELELVFKKDGEAIRLNPPNIDLHNLFLGLSR